jgi:hypothetical protein
MKFRFNVAATAQTEWEATLANLGKTPEEYLAEYKEGLGEGDIWDEIESIVAEKGMRSYVFVVELLDDEGNVVDKVELARASTS